MCEKKIKDLRIIATWYMAENGVRLGREAFLNGKNLIDSLEVAINEVERDPDYNSVGFGGLPNNEGVVECDAAVMDDRYEFGAVAGVSGIKHVFSLAKLLKGQEFNNFLVGEGAKRFALKKGFKLENMLTEDSFKKFLKEKDKEKDLKAYDGRDTVSMIFYSEGRFVSGTSTSGLFLKEPGRVGDSPLVGPGLYVKPEVGACTTTGLGEDITKANISYEVVRGMEEGLSPDESCKRALDSFTSDFERYGKKLREVSLIAVNGEGDFGVYSNTDDFSFVVSLGEDLKVYNYREYRREKYGEKR